MDHRESSRVSQSPSMGGCKLVAELPSQILTEVVPKGQDTTTTCTRSNDAGDDDDGTSTASNNKILSLNNLCHDIIHNSLLEDKDETSSIPFVAYVKAMHLHQHSKGDGDGDHDHDDHDTAAKVCPLLGIHLPLQILNKIDNPTTISEYNGASADDSKANPSKNRMSQILLNVLPLIHPSLTQLQPCALLRDSSHESDGSDNNNPQPSQNVCNLLLLRIHMTESTMEQTTEEQINEELAALYAIIEEINGEALVGAPSNVIHALTISQICFISEPAQEPEQDQGQEQFQSVKERDMSTGQDSLESSLSRCGDMVLPMCSVCRYRIEPERLGLPPPKPHQLCTHKHDRQCHNMQFLVPWDLSTCEACQLLEKRLELSGAQPFRQSNSNQIHSYSDTYSQHKHRDLHVQDKLKCYLCHIEETVWVCLTCGIVGCGRYSSGHAEQHFMEKRHPFSLELATQRIWDYETGSFIHRNDLLNCPFMQQILGAVNRAAYHGAAFCAGDTVQGGLEFGSTAKKTVMIGEQYEVLLQSALEDQAQHYEGEISRLQAELAAETVNKGQLSDSEMAEIAELERTIREMRVRVDNSSRSLVEAQAQEAGHRAKANSLLREQGVTQKILENARNDLASEEKAGQLQIEELEQQVSDITSNIRMREQIANNNDLNQAQIYGTSGEPKQNRSGKRKGFRRGRKK